MNSVECVSQMILSWFFRYFYGFILLIYLVLIAVIIDV